MHNKGDFGKVVWKGKSAGWLAAGLLSIASIAGCGSGGGGSSADVRELTWGMTLDEAIAAESKGGNELKEKKESGDTAVVTFEDVTVAGHSAALELEFRTGMDRYDVTYAIDNKEFDKLLKQFNKKGASEQEKERLQEKMIGIAEMAQMSAMATKYNDLPSEIPFEEFILTKASYSFSDLDEAGAQAVLDSLTGQYGEPLKDERSGGRTDYYWVGDRTEIQFDGTGTVDYTAYFDALERFAVLDASQE